jgi:hypothetical protein
MGYFILISLFSSRGAILFTEAAQLCVEPSFGGLIVYGRLADMTINLNQYSNTTEIIQSLTAGIQESRWKWNVFVQ